MYLTAKQKAVCDYIRGYVRRRGYGPTQREIADHFGFSSLGTVQKYLNALIGKGCLAKTYNQQRSLQVLQPIPTPVWRDLRILGTVTAGDPIRVYEDPQEYSPRTLLLGADRFALRVSGQSMVDEGIRDGDVLIVQPAATAEQGQTVVALVHQEATVKKFFRHGDTIELRPANAGMRPIFAGEQDVVIQGVVVGLIREFK